MRWRRAFWASAGCGWSQTIAAIRAECPALRAHRTVPAAFTGKGTAVDSIVERRLAAMLAADVVGSAHDLRSSVHRSMSVRWIAGRAASLTVTNAREELLSFVQARVEPGRA